MILQLIKTHDLGALKMNINYFVFLVQQQATRLFVCIGFTLEIDNSNKRVDAHYQLEVPLAEKEGTSWMCIDVKWKVSWRKMQIIWLGLKITTKTLNWNDRNRE